MHLLIGDGFPYRLAARMHLTTDRLPLPPVQLALLLRGTIAAPPETFGECSLLHSHGSDNRMGGT